MPLILDNATKKSRGFEMYWESSRIRIKTKYKMKTEANWLAKEIIETAAQQTNVTPTTNYKKASLKVLHKRVQMGLLCGLTLATRMEKKKND
jgi:hypothetical protein